ncbi:hypothetical protein KKA08_03705, partial [bacterium]|nr:hypothetical protein [bacterium]
MLIPHDFFDFWWSFRQSMVQFCIPAIDVFSKVYDARITRPGSPVKNVYWNYLWKRYGLFYVFGDNSI